MIRLYRSLSLLGVCVFLTAILSGCHVRINVSTLVEPNGTGLVEVAIGFDPDAQQELGDVASALYLDDIRAAGWSVEIEKPTDQDTYLWVKASKPFVDEQSFQQIFSEIAGDKDRHVFSSMRLLRKETREKILYEVGGNVDLTLGVGLVSDSDLSTVLDGDPFGGNLERLQQKYGIPVEQMVDGSFKVSLPGVENNLPSVREQTWELKMLQKEPTSISYSEIIDKHAVPYWKYWAAGAGIVLALFVLVFLIRRVRKMYKFKRGQKLVETMHVSDI